MITAVAFLLLVATVPLLGGRLSRLGEIRLRGWWIIATALVIQVVLIEVLSDSFGGVTAAALHLASYLLAFVFVWQNRHVVGMGIIVLGGFLNTVAIAANGGVMPARLEALERAGIISDSPTFENSAPVDNARLAFLGDVFAIPEGIPFANVYSIGDILLVIGAGLTAHIVAESKLGLLLRPGSPSATSPTPTPSSTTITHEEPVVAPPHVPPTDPVAPIRESLALRYERSLAQRSMAQRSMAQRSMAQRSMAQRPIGQRSMGVRRDERPDVRR